MTQSLPAAAPGRVWAIGAVLTDQQTLRRLRLSAGLVLFTYVTLHLLNHALLNIDWQTADELLFYAATVWTSLAGTVILYGAFILHYLAALWALYERRSLRMPFGEGLRLVLGFSIPFLAIHHFVGQRYAFSFLNITRDYEAILYVDYQLRPTLGVVQILLLLSAWLHGCIGLHYWLRLKRLYRRLVPLLLACAVLVPTLALLGIAQGVRQIARLAEDSPAWLHSMLTAAHLSDATTAATLSRVELFLQIVFAGLILFVLAARLGRSLLAHSRGSVAIIYPDGRVVRVPRGASVLEASWSAGIPHACVCGGRGRCSTCRIRVLRGFDGLPEASPSETALLARLLAGPTVRLACQLRPRHDIAVLPLLPPDIGPDDQRRRAPDTDMERFLAILFVDIRQSTALIEKRLPYDVIFLLNHFFEAMGGAVAQAGGTPNQFIGDGMMAIFGLHADPDSACRQALAASRLMGERLEEMNRVLADELRHPIAVGIGLHAGHVIVGELGYRDRVLTTAIGDSVNVAARLQELTKEYACQMVVSDVVFEQAGMQMPDLPGHEIRVRGRDTPLTIRTVKAVAELTA